MSDPVNLATEALRAGRLVVIPTETVYGLGADATNDHAVASVYEVKGRPVFNPLIAHVATTEHALELGILHEPALMLAKAFWPGPLTLVVPRRPDCPVSLLACAGLSTLAIRIPRHPIAQRLLLGFGGPIVAPSANQSGKISPTTVEHARAALGNKVAVFLDGGPCNVGLESTVIGFENERPVLLRAGGVPSSDIEAVLNCPLMANNPKGPVTAPGQLESHYAPTAELRINASEPRSGEVFIGFGPSDGDFNLSPGGNLVEAAANLFRILHEADASGAKAIAVASIPMVGLGEAINDRLKRAAAPRPR